MCSSARAAAHDVLASVAAHSAQAVIQLICPLPQQRCASRSAPTIAPARSATCATAQEVVHAMWWSKADRAIDLAVRGFFLCDRSAPFFTPGIYSSSTRRRSVAVRDFVASHCFRSRTAAYLTRQLTLRTCTACDLSSRYNFALCGACIPNYNSHVSSKRSACNLLHWRIIRNPCNQ